VCIQYAFRVTPGDTSSNKNTPLVLDDALKLGESPYSMAALFGGGISVVGKLSKLRGKGLIIPVVLSLIKIMVAPFAAYYISR
jgi:hypothetical protein